MKTLLLILAVFVAYNLAGYVVQQLLGTEEIWVYGTCSDYDGNRLQCQPGEEHAGRGVSVGPGSLVLSSGCYTECTPLAKPYAYRAAPHHADTLAGFAAVAVVIAATYLVERARGHRSAEGR